MAILKDSRQAGPTAHLHARQRRTLKRDPPSDRQRPSRSRTAPAHSFRPCAAYVSPTLTRRPAHASTSAPCAQRFRTEACRRIVTDLRAGIVPDLLGRSLGSNRLRRQPSGQVVRAVAKPDTEMTHDRRQALGRRPGRRVRHCQPFRRGPRLCRSFVPSAAGL